ncbi:U3 small nucleolar ribonucleoprotein IMP3 [Platysternon megacephalum]|uniref:U3 small nucleolar ribonucleoprotein IMP3 n=1 Tax=Platysternon megacephalum TaxID=55544 RepID=A0A4D9ESV6_9SAUR|nr:U3 small nucleolar ribonucleoprotein IMP3 [Platysternon megacephalum]
MAGPGRQEQAGEAGSPPLPSPCVRAAAGCRPVLSDVSPLPAADLLQTEPLEAPTVTPELAAGRGGSSAAAAFHCPQGPAGRAPGCRSVSVVFPGPVTQQGCCHFACELLKHVLYQRHQLPLPYEQLAYFCRRALPRQPQDGDAIKKKPHPPDLGSSRKCQQLLMELEGVFRHLEAMFNLTLVPRVLILVGGNSMSPKELYEINLEGISVGNAEESLQTPSCVRKLFHSLFLADVFSELQAVPVMGTIVMVQGHRDCGIDWFRPKLNYKVPTRGRKLTVNLSCGGNSSTNSSSQQGVTSVWDNYIWFQAPVTVKGFHE